MDFKDWIVRYQARNSRRGDLAYDIARDSRFPRGDDKAVFLYYLKEIRRAHPAAITAFREAYRAYSEWKQRYLDEQLLAENIRLANRVRELESLLAGEEEPIEPLYRKSH